MELNTETYDKLVKMVSQFNVEKNSELEAKFKRNFTSENFVTVMQYCRSLDFTETVHDESLDIFVLNDNPLRITISGRDNVSRYCRTNTVSGDELVIQKRTLARPVYFQDVKVDLKNEVPIDPADILQGLSKLDKGYRFKKRYSYVDNSETARIDLTLVKSSKMRNGDFQPFKSFAESGTHNSPYSFEIEVELIKRSKYKKDFVGTLKSFLSVVFEILSVLNGEDYIISPEEKESVLKEYLKLSLGKDYYDPKAPKRSFAGPQPITLEQSNVIKKDLGVVTILDKYTVTEKADGERMLLFVNKNGKCYFVNSRLNIIFTGVKLDSLSNSLVDGEFITRSIMNKSVKYFALFDIYYKNGHSTAGLPLIHTKKGLLDRYSAMKEFATVTSTRFLEKGIKIFAKTFYAGDDIFEESKKALKASYDYQTDGLIYTPRDLVVGASHEGDKKVNLTGTWNRVFKWKPSQNNTIDFLVRDSGNNFTIINGVKYKVLDIYVGCNPIQWTPIKTRQYLEGKVIRTNSYIAEKFIPGDIADDTFAQCYVEIDKMYCEEDGTKIISDTIIEFKYINDENLIYPLRWKPLRIRQDKTEMFKTSGLSGTANDYGTAMNIWRSIKYPVTEKMVRGEEQISNNDIVNDDVYYYRNMSRDSFASKPMLDFHNYWVKSKTVFGKVAGKTSLLDVSCGKGGDIPKWLDNNITKVLGIDISRDNIENPVDGAYARTLDNRSQKYDPAKHNYTYVRLDSSQKFTREYFDSLPNNDDRLSCLNLWGLQKTESMSKWFNFVKDKFEVISCQFSIHYFFETEKKLDNLLWNINEHIRDNGYFIGTCLDGNKIKRELENISKGERVEGVSNDRTIWSIRKLYDKNHGISFGEEIEVYMESIGRWNKEYLVNFDILIEKLKKYGIELEIYQSFDNIYKEFEEADLTNENKYFTESIKKMKTDQASKSYSFMNVWFKFCKKTVEAAQPEIKKKPVIRHKVPVEIPEEPKVVPMEPKVVPMEPKVIPNEPKIVPVEPKEAPKKKIIIKKMK